MIKTFFINLLSYVLTDKFENNTEQFFLLQLDFSQKTIINQKDI